MKPPANVISLGLGQQSTTLYFMSSLGELPCADVAIFADPGAEHDETYTFLSKLKAWQAKNNGIPILHVGKRSLEHDLIQSITNGGQRFTSIPAFTRDGQGNIGMLRRQCTHEYKISEVHRAIRQLYGVRPHGRTPPTKVWIGISLEELTRMKFPQTSWLTHLYPFCNYIVDRSGAKRGDFPEMTRTDCRRWLQAKGLPIPPKSACYFCPYQSDRSWRALKTSGSAQWDRAVQLDQRIRYSTRKGVNFPVYLHRSGTPLSEVDFQENQTALFKNDCDGFCGV